MAATILSEFGKRMSDYLNNLAAKSLNHTEVIQPRLASLFEPPSVAGGLVSGYSSSNVETAQGEQLFGETLLETPLTAQAPFRNMLPPIVPQPGETRPEPFPTQHEPNPAQMILTQTPASSPHRNTPGLVPRAAGYENADAPSRNTGEQESQSALVQNIKRIMDEQSALLAVPRSQNIRHPESDPIQARQSLTPAAVVAQGRGARRTESAAPASPESTATQGQTPTIRITIGRVDVRAIMPASPAPRPTLARPGPALSLEDYLKQRERGRR